MNVREAHETCNTLPVRKFNDNYYQRVALTVLYGDNRKTYASRTIAGRKLGRRIDSLLRLEFISFSDVEL